MTLHCTPDLGRALRQSLLRFCIIALTWDRPHPHSTTLPDDDEIQCIASIDRLWSIDANTRGYIDRWNDVLVCPALATIRSIAHHSGGLNHVNVGLLQRLPYLDTLHTNSFGPSSLMSNVHTLPQLTRLSIMHHDVSMQDDDPIFQAITAPHVHHFAFSRIEGESMLRLLSLPRMATIRALTLDGIILCTLKNHETLVGILSRCFAGLMSLQSLTVRDMFPLDTLLVGAACLPSLRYLEMKLFDYMNTPVDHCVPSVTLIVKMLHDRPSLTVTLILGRNASTVPSPEWRATTAHLMELADAHAPRFVVKPPHEWTPFGPDMLG
jgi:hypothetical protein